MTFGNGVRKILKERGINQNQFAEMLGKSPQNLSKLLKMDRPTMKTVEQMAKALALEPFELIQGMTDKSGIFRVYVETGGEQEDIESPYERLLKYAEYRGIDVTQLSEETGVPLAQLHKNSTKKLIIPEGIVWGIRKLYPDLNITWLLQGSGGMLQTGSAEDELIAAKLNNRAGVEMDKAVTKLSEWTGLDESDVASFINARKVSSSDVATNAGNAGGKLMKILDMDEESSMERLIRNKAYELEELERNRRELLSTDHVIELFNNSMKDLYQLAKLESTRVKFFGDAEYIKTEGTTRFFSLGHGMFFLLTILIKESEVKHYLPNHQNLAYVEDFSRYIVTLDKLHFAEYRSFEVTANVGGSCKSHIKPGNIVTAKKLNSNSGRQMEFIQDSECVLVFKDRIMFTQIVGWDAAEGLVLYEDPRNGTMETHVNDLLEIYTIEIVTQSRETQQLSLFPR